MSHIAKSLDFTAIQGFLFFSFAVYFYTFSYIFVQKYVVLTVVFLVLSRIICLDQFPCLFNILHIDMSIYIRCDGYIRMSHKPLSRPDVNPGATEIRAVGMAKAIRDKIIRQGQRRDESVPIDLAAHRDIHIPL